MKKFLILVIFLVLNVLPFAQQTPTIYDCTLKSKNINYFTKVAAPSIYKDRNALHKIQTVEITASYE